MPAFVHDREAHVAQVVLVNVQARGVEHAFGQRRAFAQHDLGGHGIGDVVEVAQHDARALLVARHVGEQHAQGGGLGAAPDQRAQAGEGVQVRVFAGVAGAVVGAPRLQVHHHDVDHDARRQFDLGVQRRAREAVRVAAAGRHGDVVREHRHRPRMAHHRQARDQRHARRQARRFRIGIEAQVDRLAVTAGARQHLAQGGLRKNLLEADHVGIEQVDLVRGPVQLGLVFLRRARREVLVAAHARRGQVIGVEGGKANFLLHNRNPLYSSLAYHAWPRKSTCQRHPRRSSCASTASSSRNIPTTTKNMAEPPFPRVHWTCRSTMS